MERNQSKNGLVNVLALLAGGLALVVLSRYEKSSSAEVGAVFLLVGLLVSLVSWFQMRLEAREEAERLEVEALSRSRNDSALFSESAAETFPARRAREQFERWLVPAFAVLLCALEGFAVWVFYTSLVQDAGSMSAPDPTLALAAFSGIGLVLFLLGKYASRLAQLEDSRLLRPGASAVLMGALIAGASALVAAADWAGYPQYDRYLAYGLVGLLGLVAVETLIALVFEVYRPRVKGKAARLIYESRIVGLLGQSGGLFSTAAHALDYQFGFKVSETWFYKFFEGALAKLVLVWLGILVACSCVVVIEPGEQGLLERFGRPVDGRGVLEPGLNLKFPWPVDAVVRYDTRALQSFNVGYVPDPEKEKERTVLWTRAHYKEEFNLLVASREQQSSGVEGDQTVPVNLITASIPEPELQTVIDNLSARGLGGFVKVDYGVIRGLAYYTGLVFEAFDRKGEFRAIAGGGRYDQLVKQVSEGKADLPALGFGMGDVVLAELLKVRKLVPSFTGTVDAVVLIEDETLRAASLGVVQQLREAGRAADYSLTPAKGDKQFKRALELGATRTVRLERGADGTVVAKIKDLKTREEKSVAPGEVATAIAG